VISILSRWVSYKQLQTVLGKRYKKRLETRKNPQNARQKTRYCEAKNITCLLPRRSIFDHFYSAQPAAQPLPAPLTSSLRTFSLSRVPAFRLTVRLKANRHARSPTRGGIPASRRLEAFSAEMITLITNTNPTTQRIHSSLPTPSRLLPYRNPRRRCDLQGPVRFLGTHPDEAVV
jgi:hypothetical protein